MQPENDGLGSDDFPGGPVFSGEPAVHLPGCAGGNLSQQKTSISAPLKPLSFGNRL